MKTLKKALVLVLVLSMVISVAAIGASAAFTDTTTSKYGEAIDVLSAIGVINGITSTTFEPTGSLTREQAAKVIAYLLLGPTNAALISNASSQQFSDVPATRWSAGYIEYCASAGIINGMGDGTFAPTAPLTTAAFTKMLLCAVGYKADAEGLTGASWAINTASLAVTAGIYDTTITISASANCTREQAAQLAFKALKAAMVQYTGGTSITVGGTTITTGATRSFVANGTVATPVAQTITNDYLMQFGEQHFPLLVYTSSTSDGFGRPAHMWMNNSAFVGMYKDTPVLSYNASKVAFPSTVATDLAGYTLADNSDPTVYKSIDNITSVSYTGATGVVVSNGTPSALSPSSQTTAAAIAALTGNGKLVEFYADYSKHITKIVVITYTVGTISNIVTTSDRTTYTLASNNASPSYTTAYDFVSPTVTDTIYGQTGMAKGDTITYVTTAGGSTFVYPTTKVTGTATSYSSLGSLTVSGTTYPIGLAVTDVSSFGAGVVAANYFIDQFGYVVKTSATAASTNYAYIVGKYGTLTTDINGSVPTAQVKAVKSDGTVGVYTLSLTKVTTAGGTANFNNGTSITKAVGDYIVTGTNVCVYDASASNSATTANTSLLALADVYGYTLTDTTITFQTLADASGSMVAGATYFDTTVNNLGYGVTSVTGSLGETALINASTVYVIYNTTLGTVTTYTGNAGLPTTATAGSLDSNNVVMTANAAAIGTAGYVFRTETAAYSAATTTNYVYVNAFWYSTSLNSANVTVYTYPGAKADGTYVDVTTTTQLPLAATSCGLYTYNSDKVLNTTALATDATTTLSDQFVYDGTLTVTGSMLNAGTGYYNITADTKTVFVDPTKGSIDGNAGYVVLSKVYGVVTSNVETIYIVG